MAGRVCLLTRAAVYTFGRNSTKGEGACNTCSASTSAPAARKHFCAIPAARSSRRPVAEHAISQPKPGYSEQNPADWWAATQAATKAVIKKAKIKGSDISAIGLSGQMHGSTFLDRSGNVIRPAMLWNDQRTSKQCAEIEKKAGGRAKLIEMVANPALTGFTAPKILWLRENEPKNFEKVRQILLPKDYIRYCLTGEYATEVSDASGTLLLDVVNRKWSKKLLTKLDIDPELLPRVYESFEVSGTLSRQSAALLGLAEGTPVVGGGGDQAAGAVGNGVVTAGVISAAMGTSGVMFAHAEKPTLDPLGRVHTMCHAVPGKWCVFGCMLSAGGSFQWFRNQLGQNEIAAAKKAESRSLSIAHRAGRFRPCRLRRAILPALPHRRALSAPRPARAGRVDRPDQPHDPADDDSRTDRRRHIRHERYAADH